MFSDVPHLLKRADDEEIRLSSGSRAAGVGAADTCNFEREMNTLTFLSVQTRLNKGDGL